MVNIFGTSDTKVGKRGRAGVDGVDGIKDIIKWFPTIICDLFRKKVNVLTLFINTIPPEKDPDVELFSNRKVKKWLSYNNRDNLILTSVDKKAGELASLPYGKRYGLVFDKKQKIMYHIPDCRNMYLSINGANVLLTLTFKKVGNKESSDNNDVEEFIASDYHWSKYDKRSDVHRGISIITKSDQKFDLYLQGAIGNDGQNKMKIGEDLEQDAFYTLQVCWRRTGIEKTGFYSLYKYRQLLIDKTSFQHHAVPILMRPAFYVGGFNASRGETVIKSKCFTGIISNLEVIQTDNDSISNDVLKLIVDGQSVINPWPSKPSSLFNGEDEPPAVKRIKLTNQ